MPKLKLTDRGVRALRADGKRVEYWDTNTPGFGVRVSGSTDRATKTWVVRYRANGRHRKLKLGRYPDLSLARARKRAKDVLADVADGDDPAAVREILRSDDATFESMAREVLDAKAKITRKTTQRERKRLLERELLPTWRGRPAGSITPRDVVELTEGIAKRGAPVIANRTLALVRMLYNRAVKRGFPGVESNPAAKADPPGEEGGRDRYLDRAEIRAVWLASEEELLIPRSIFRIALLTAQRVGSVCRLRWSDVDSSGVWTIPAEVFKGGRPHAVPLSPEAREILDELREAVRGVPEGDVWAFPAGRSDGSAPHTVSTNSLLRRLRTEAGIPHWTLHDLRRTFRTWATRSAESGEEADDRGLGVAPHVADAVLGHKEASLGFARYTGDAVRYLLPEKREALERWGRFVSEVVRERT